MGVMYLMDYFFLLSTEEANPGQPGLAGLMGDVAALRENLRKRHMAGGSPPQEENELGCLAFDSGRNGGAISGSMTCSGFNVFLVMRVWQDDDEEEGEEESEDNIYDKKKKTKKTRRRRRRTTGTGNETKLYWLPLIVPSTSISASLFAVHASGRDEVMFCTLAFARHASGECIIQPGIYDEIHKQMHKPSNQNDDY